MTSDTASGTPTGPGAIEVPGVTGGSSSLNAFRHRDFTVFWFAALVSNSGTWMQMVAVPLVLFRITDGSTWVGIASFATLVPSLFLSPIAGALADRYDRRRIMILCNVGFTISGFALWWVWVSDNATPLNIVFLLAVSGVLTGIQMPSWQSFVPLLVPKEALIDAVRLNSIQFNVARAIGPAFAGLVLGEFGAGGAFFINAITFLCVIVALMAVHPREVAVPRREPVMQELREGVRYVRDRPGLRLCVTGAGVIATVGLATVTAAPAPFAEDVFHVGEGSLGLLVAMVGVGGIIGAVVVLAANDHLARSHATLMGLVGYVAAIFLLGVAPSFEFGLVAMTVLGAAHVVTSISINTAIQAQVEERYRGRTMSLYLMAVFAGAPLGALVQGFLGDGIGRRASVLIPAVFFLAWLLWAYFRYHRFRDLDADREIEIVEVV